ncbi:MAG: ATP-binding protein [Rubricoccaceae bacterium]|nr:ATP-binding protein [Rubricoccaceae bacterium]
MTLLKRRLRVFWLRYVAPGSLERDPRFRVLLRALTRQGLQFVGVVTALGVVLHVLSRVLAGDAVTWIEADGGLAGSVQLWDKVLLAALGLGLAALGRARTGLRVGRMAVAVFLVVVTWFVVLRNFEPGSFNMAAAWLTLLMVIAVGTVPFRPWQMGLLGLAMTAEFWGFALVTPGMSGDRPRLLFLLLVTAVITVVAAVLYASRYLQYRALRRLAHLKDYCAARSRELERVLGRERGMKDQLVQQEKLASLGQLTAGIAHEIKNPLNFVNNFAGLSKELAVEVRDALRADPDRPARAVEEELGEALDDLVLNTEKIAEHGWRADGIVKSMLAHSRMSPGEHEPTDLNALLEEYVGLAYHGMRARHPFEVEIERQYDDALEPIPVVPQELGRVFLNLLANAFDALRAHAADAGDGFTPRLRVSTRRTPDGAVVYVTDNGPGMPRKVVERVFEPFFTTKPSGEGTGLGLSLAYEIVTQGHGGTLDVRSREGEGTVFSITLPAVPPQEGGPAPRAVAA